MARYLLSVNTVAGEAGKPMTDEQLQDFMRKVGAPSDVAEVDSAPKLEDAEVGRIFREELGRSLAALIRVFGNIELAEDAVQEAFEVALARWPDDGLPPKSRGLDHDHRAQPRYRSPAARVARARVAAV